MKPFIIFLLLLALTHITHAQNQEIFRAKTALSVNIGMQPIPGILFGVGQPRICFEQEVVYWPKRGVSMGFRLGVGRLLLSMFDWSWYRYEETITVAGVAYVLTGRKNHHFEAAVGPEFWIDQNEYIPPIFPYLEAGYRYQKPSSGLFVRGFLGSTSLLGLGVGYSFPVKNK